MDGSASIPAKIESHTQTAGAQQTTEKALGEQMETKSLGLSGLWASISNFSAVVVLAGILVWLLTINIPGEHDRWQAAREREAIREEAWRDKWGATMERHDRALNDLTNEFRLMRRQIKE